MAVVAGAVVFGGVGKSRLGSLFAGPSLNVITYPVRYANLPVVVSERGSLESSKNEDAYCKVEGQTTIIMIVSEGTRVSKGQLVCELDSSALKDALTNQVITTKGADAAYQNARLTREVAEIAVEEYEQGVYKQNLESCKIEIALAQSDLKRAEDRLDWSERMYKKGYLSLGQNMSERLALQRAKFALEQAQTKIRVLEKYTKHKTVKEFNAEVEKARSDELAKKSTWTLEQTKEDKLRLQITNCKITAPNDGLVVYANDPNKFGGSSQPQIEEGATVRERQKIFSLPDITKMRVNTKVHESMIDRIRPGMLARIKVDAFAEETLPGVVDDIAPLPDPSSFFSSDVKVYTTHVAIERGLSGLRPGMTAQVEILVIDVPNVLSVPVQAGPSVQGEGPPRRQVGRRVHLARRCPGHVQRQARRGQVGAQQRRSRRTQPRSAHVRVREARSLRIVLGRFQEGLGRWQVEGRHDPRRRGLTGRGRQAQAQGQGRRHASRASREDAGHPRRGTGQDEGRQPGGS